MVHLNYDNFIVVKVCYACIFVHHITSHHINGIVSVIENQEHVGHLDLFWYSCKVDSICVLQSYMVGVRHLDDDM